GSSAGRPTACSTPTTGATNSSPATTGGEGEHEAAGDGGRQLGPGLLRAPLRDRPGDGGGVAAARRGREGELGGAAAAPARRSAADAARQDARGARLRDRRPDPGVPAARDRARIRRDRLVRG